MSREMHVSKPSQLTTSKSGVKKTLAKAKKALKSASKFFINKVMKAVFAVGVAVSLLVGDGKVKSVPQREIIHVVNELFPSADVYLIPFINFTQTNLIVVKNTKGFDEILSNIKGKSIGEAFPIVKKYFNERYTQKKLSLLHGKSVSSVPMKPFISSSDVLSGNFDLAHPCVDAAAFSFALLKQMGYNPNMVSIGIIIRDENGKFKGSFLHETVFVDSLVFDLFSNKPVKFNEYLEGVVWHLARQQLRCNKFYAEVIVTPSINLMNLQEKKRKEILSALDSVETSFNKKFVMSVKDLAVPFLSYDEMNKFTKEIINDLNKNKGVIINYKFNM